MEKEAPKHPTRSPSSGSEDSEEEELASEEGIEGGSMTAATSLDPNVLKNRREKRLAMNRASARARRKRKKELLGSLAAQVQELTNQNQVLQTKNDSLSSRVEQLETALTQAQGTITTLSSGGSAVQSLHQPLTGGTSAGVGQLGDSALRSLLLGRAGAGLSGVSAAGANSSASPNLGAGLSYEAILTARAQQHLDLQNQLRLLGASSGLGAPGLGSLPTSALGSDRLGSLGGVSGLSAFLGAGLGQGMPPSASQLDSLVRAKINMQQAEEQGTTDKTSLSPAKGGEGESVSNMIATAAGIHQDGPAAKKPRVL